MVLCGKPSPVALAVAHSRYPGCPLPASRCPLPVPAPCRGRSSGFSLHGVWVHAQEGPNVRDLQFTIKIGRKTKKKEHRLELAKRAVKRVRLPRRPHTVSAHP